MQSDLVMEQSDLGLHYSHRPVSGKFQDPYSNWDILKV